MKTKIYLFLCVALAVANLAAQETSRRARPLISTAPNRSTSPANYSADLAVVQEARGSRRWPKPKEMLETEATLRDRPALELAIKEMERAQTALAAAKDAPEKVSAALAAQQAALSGAAKNRPARIQHEAFPTGQPERGQSQSQQRQLNQLDMQREENRYETERQAATPQNAQQRQQSQTADRLKELSQRQQDLNQRLRELQTALQTANTDKEREEIQRQLKRLQDEQRQMLANVDELRQKLEQAPNASSQAETQRQWSRRATRWSARRRNWSNSRLRARSPPGNAHRRRCKICVMICGTNVQSVQRTAAGVGGSRRATSRNSRTRSRRVGLAEQWGKTNLG